jgi:hypothetical protein
VRFPAAGRGSVAKWSNKNSAGLTVCLEGEALPRPPAEVSIPAPAAVLDELTQRRLAVTAFAMGVSTHQIEDLLRVILAEDGPDHSAIARWVTDQPEKAKLVIKALYFTRP